jgi:hypothetical protein
MNFSVILALLALLFTCAEDDQCVFDGRYVFGGLPLNGCQPFSYQFVFFEVEDTCSESGSDVSDDGTAFRYSMECTPGQPVTTCTGSYQYADGCLYDGTIRRISP